MNDSNAPWLVKKPELKAVERAYLFLFYWVFTIITTVGYGDFTGGTTIEYLITIAIEFIGIIVFAGLA